MRLGKLPELMLKRSVLNYISENETDFLHTAAVGNDCALLQVHDAQELLFTVDPLHLNGYQIRKNGLSRIWNNLAAGGGTPIAVLVDFLLPLQAEEPQIKALSKQLSTLAAQQGVTIVGGSTRVMAEVSQPVVTVTGIGRRLCHSEEQGYKVCSGKKAGKKLCPGMELVMSKWIGMEGSVLLLEEYEEKLIQRFAPPFLAGIADFIPHLSVLPEAAIAVKSGVGVMHDVSEGGIFGALWEMAESSGVGLAIRLRDIPVRQQTVEICEVLGVNPYTLLSGGALLMGADDGRALVRALQTGGIAAAVIGRATGGNDRILVNEGEIRYLDRPAQDEWYRLMET